MGIVGLSCGPRKPINRFYEAPWTVPRFLFPLLTQDPKAPFRHIETVTLETPHFLDHNFRVAGANAVDVWRLKVTSYR